MYGGGGYGDGGDYMSSVIVVVKSDVWCSLYKNGTC